MEPRKVMVLHKCGDGETDRTDGKLAVGRTFTFPRSGDAYTVQESGAVVNAKPKPWKNKAERKKILRERKRAGGNEQTPCSP